MTFVANFVELSLFVVYVFMMLYGAVMFGAAFQNGRLFGMPPAPFLLGAVLWPILSLILIPLFDGATILILPAALAWLHSRARPEERSTPFANPDPTGGIAAGDAVALWNRAKALEEKEAERRARPRWAAVLEYGWVEVVCLAYGCLLWTQNWRLGLQLISYMAFLLVYLGWSSSASAPIP